MSHKFYLPAVLIALFGLAACASSPSTSNMAAANSHATGNQPNTQAVDDPNRVVCRYEKPVGTHFPQKVCRPAWQWAQAQKAAQDQMKKMQTSQGSRSCTGCGGGN